MTVVYTVEQNEDTLAWLGLDRGVRIHTEIAAPIERGTLDCHVPYALVLETRVGDFYGSKVHCGPFSWLGQQFG